MILSIRRNLIHQQHFRPQLENKNFARNGSGDDISITSLVSTSDYFYEKLMTKTRKKKFLEKGALSVFKYSNYLPPCQKSEKSIEPFLRTMPNRQHRRTDRQLLFYRTLLGRGSKKFFLNI